MRLETLQRTELRHYFAIKTDLAAAVEGAAPEEIAHHLDEIEILAMHTQSDRLRRACRATLAERAPTKAAANA